MKKNTGFAKGMCVQQTLCSCEDPSGTEISVEIYTQKRLGTVSVHF